MSECPLHCNLNGQPLCWLRGDWILYHVLFVQTGRMTMVDLGSNEAPATDKRDAVKTTNQSLFTFARVIQALARQDARVPYRSVSPLH